MCLKVIIYLNKFASTWSAISTGQAKRSRKGSETQTDYFTFVVKIKYPGMPSPESGLFCSPSLHHYLFYITAFSDHFNTNTFWSSYFFLILISILTFYLKLALAFFHELIQSGKQGTSSEATVFSTAGLLIKVKSGILVSLVADEKSFSCCVLRVMIIVQNDFRTNHTPH